MAKIGAKKICQIGIMSALSFVLSLLTFPIGDIHISFASLPTAITAITLGPIPGALVGAIGEFLKQIIAYGFSATTLLWILPPTIRGLLIGAMIYILKQYSTNFKVVDYVGINLISAFIVTMLNSVVMYIDANIYGYYTKGVIYAGITMRLLTGFIIAFLVGLVTKPIIEALQRNKLV